jgi:mannose-6-phosphate isomerase-like protein (cupin superfamily)
MPSLKRVAWFATGWVLISVLPSLETQIHGQNQILVWAPQPLKANPWIAPNKPITKLAELRAKHASEQNWTETVVDDNLFRGQYISMAPGAKTPRRFHQDNRAWWIVEDGKIRFTIEGQEPFIASKGFLVQVPHRNTYSMETVGDKPSLRFEVTIANANTMYPIDETPAPAPGIKYPNQGCQYQGNV